MTFLQPPFWASERGGARGWPQHVGLSLVTPPVGEPLSIEDLKTHVKVDGSESDAELTDWGIAARMDTETFTRCAWLTQSVDVTLSHFPFDRRAIVIPIRPLLSVTGIDYVDASGVAQTLDPSLYTVDAPKPVGGVPEFGRVSLAYGQFFWPFPPAMRVTNGVTLHCVVGYGPTAASTPATAKTAMKLLVGNWWRNREAGAIVRGSSDSLPYGVDRVLAAFVEESIA
jgi:uncharacterized phiE125 gp8 family phage protein